MKNPTTTSSSAAVIFASTLTGPINARTREALTHLLLWIAEGSTYEQRGLRVAVLLYCTRPDLIGNVTLEHIGEQAGCTRQTVHKLAEDFRSSMGIAS